eukprot:TRINITY_DN4703_c0_g1_i13.p1 TRINITY_DN4703_c0_g1~~TRINITY_DN4703_c0_g1_i13.p1  ORF type:complete len:213 (-),score=40.12 TRINITY_DN4703_c0_g1_i13:1018-1587(-)
MYSLDSPYEYHKRVTINELSTVMQESKVLGRVIKKNSAREFMDKQSREKRFVLSFIMRDQQDSIAVTVWGTKVNTASDFGVGSVVVVENALIKKKSMYTLNSSSPYELHVDDKHGSICQFEDASLFETAVRGPLRKDFVSLDQLNEHVGQEVNVLCMVGKIFDGIGHSYVLLTTARKKYCNYEVTSTPY